MNKIPTAYEFAWNHKEKLESSESFLWENVLIEFAKLHVKAAIEECIESAPSGSSTDTVSYEDVVKALKNCYPDENIK